jgi:hypothetical protein
LRAKSEWKDLRNLQFGQKKKTLKVVERKDVLRASQELVRPTLHSLKVMKALKSKFIQNTFL